METSHIPFQDVIIHDGIVIPHRVCFGKILFQKGDVDKLEFDKRGLEWL